MKHALDGPAWLTSAIQVGNAILVALIGSVRHVLRGLSQPAGRLSSRLPALARSMMFLITRWLALLRRRCGVGLKR
jgi:hypothetical protein